MEPQVLFNAAIAAILLLSGWILRAMWDAVHQLRSEVSEIQKEIHANYVRRDDYKEDITEVKEILREIFNKLDSKADK